MFSQIRKRIEALRKSVNIVNDIDVLIDSKIRCSNLQVRAQELISPLTRQFDGSETEQIVSLTSYGNRIHTVHLAIESMGSQTCLPHRVILWLDQSEFSEQSLPQLIQKQCTRGLEVRYCPNYGPYKKLVPALQNFPQASIITIDDDILYPHDMIEILLKEHQLFPRTILGHRAHKMRFGPDGQPAPYLQWGWESLDSEPSQATFITGGGGSLYPAGAFSDEVLNDKVFLSLSPTADDVWLKAMALLNGTEVKKVRDNRPFGKRFLPIFQTDSEALFTINKQAAGNDQQIRAVWEKYGL